MSEREIRERAELGDALCLLMLLWSEDELDEADDDEIMLFLVAFGYGRLYKWQDGDADPLVRQLLDIGTTSPQLLRESCRFEQDQLIQLRNLLGVLPQPMHRLGRLDAAAISRDLGHSGRHSARHGTHLHRGMHAQNLWAVALLDAVSGELWAVLAS